MAKKPSKTSTSKSNKDNHSGKTENKPTTNNSAAPQSSKQIITSKANRPISPHLSIYKPQITSVLSITHRITGFALYGGTLLLFWWIVANVYHTPTQAVVGSNYIPALISVDMINQFIVGDIGKLILTLWSLALFYHLFNGIRHLFWDIGLGFSLPAVRKSGILVLVLSVVATYVCWIL